MCEKIGHKLEDICNLYKGQLPEYTKHIRKKKNTTKYRIHKKKPNRIIQMIKQISQKRKYRWSINTKNMLNLLEMNEILVK